MSAITAVPTAIPTGIWAVDRSHSKIGFAVKHMGIATVRGEFDTNEPQRDDHLRSADFFDAATYPELNFESRGIEQIDDETFRIVGDLTLHGITNELVLTAEINGVDVDPYGNQKVGLEVTGQLSRGEYEMKFNQALGSGNVLVADKVKLALDISAAKQV